MSRPGAGIGRILWWLAVVVTVALLVGMTTAWAMRNVMLGGSLNRTPVASVLYELGGWPSQVRQAFATLFPRDDDVSPLLQPLAEIRTEGWVDRFPQPADPGYLLLSQLDAGTGWPSVRLLRIADGREMIRWDPDWRAVFREVLDHPWGPAGNPRTLDAVHPLLLDDASIVFNARGTVLVRQDACRREARWVRNGPYHHSIERDAEGMLWVGGVGDGAWLGNPQRAARFRDDTLVRVSPDGEALESRSVARILSENGYDALVFGIGGEFVRDPIHLNQVTPALRSGPYWERGDLLVSLRHLSTVFLYRPSTGRVLWLRTGPWMNQHASLFIDDRRISVFDNNVPTGSSPGAPVLRPGDVNRAFVYDFATDTLSQPWQGPLEQARVMTHTQGRAEVLADGGLFVEDSNNGRHLRFDANGLLWSRIARHDARHVSRVSWGRYLTEAQVRPAIEAAKRSGCGA